MGCLGTQISRFGWHASLQYASEDGGMCIMPANVDCRSENGVPRRRSRAERLRYGGVPEALATGLPTTARSPCALSGKRLH